MSAGLPAPEEWADGSPAGVEWPRGARWVRSGGRVFLSTGPRVIRFLETRCVFTQARWVGQPMRLRPWQRRLVVDLFEIDPATGRRRYRWALIGMGKKQGKSELVAGLALYFLVADGELAPMVLCAGANETSADLVFNPARVMVEQSETLGEVCEPYTKQILVPGQANAEIRRVAASPKSTEGLNVFVAFLDELHEWTTAGAMITFDKITNGTGAREEPMIIMTTTAGHDLESICGQQYEYGRAVEAGEVDDPGFFFRWWQAPADLDWRSEEAVAAANPNYGVTVQWPFYLDQQSKKPENIYRRYFLNQWTATEAAWLPSGAWASCEDGNLGLVAGWPTFIGWDAASKNDSTALVAVQRVPVIYEADDGGEEVGERVVVRAWVWARPWDPQTRQPVEGWRLPIDEVTARLWDLAGRYDVRAVQFDPAFITWEAGRLEAAGLPMLEFPQHTIRLTQGSQSLYELVVNGELAHDGDRVLARHVAAAVARQVPGSAAWRLVKGKGRHKMDAAVALAMAVWGLEHPPEERARPRKPNLYTFEEAAAR